MFDLSPFKPKKENGIRVVVNPHRFCIEVNNLSKERFFYMTGITSSKAKKGSGYTRNKLGIPYDIMFNDIPLFHSEVVRALDNRVRGNKILEKKPKSIEEMRKGYKVDITVIGTTISLAVCLGQIVVANRKFEFKTGCQLPLKDVKGKEIHKKFFTGNKLFFKYTAEANKFAGDFLLECLAKYTEKWEREMIPMDEARELNRFERIRKNRNFKKVVDKA